LKPLKMPSYGGQALIEGVLMRGRFTVAAAMRAPDGTIHIETEPLTGIYKTRWIKIPFLRGVLALWDAMGLGMRFLTKAANLQSPEDEKIEGKSAWLTVGGALLFAVAIFFAGPAGLAQLLNNLIALPHLVSSLVEGLIRLAIVLGYMWAVGRIPEIGRVFAYHGAEHKTINAFEDGAQLTPGNVMGYSLEHPRCGTAFLLTLVVISIIVFTILGPMPAWMRILTRIVFIPILAGLAYEYTRWTAGQMDHPIVRWMIRPNLALQHLTTREPDLSMVEVAIAAFEKMREEESKFETTSGLIP
jgi:uncharacterized protein YqhQ